MSNRAKKKRPESLLKVEFTLSTPQEGFQKCDCDLRKTLPQKSGTVEEALFVHRLEYIPGKLRVAFMEELWRILAPSGKASFITCYWTSPRAIQDPDYEWPPLCEQSFLYFNKTWRDTNKLPPIKCDFDFTYGYQVDMETAGRNQESQAFWIKHYVNAANDLQLALTKRA